MLRPSVIAFAGVLLGIMIAGCGSHRATVTSTARTSPGRAHPHAIEPAAGVQAPALTSPGAAPVGDPNAHARPLAQVKRELAQLNRCGGAITAAEAQPFFNTGKGPGFVADPGTIQNVGQLPQLTAQLNALGKALGVTIYGISGYMTPAHSVAVGGYADDPHTRGEAEDIGVNSLLRSSAAQITEAELVRFGLYRPFDPSDDPNNSEVNHVQLIPAGGLRSVGQANGTLAPDPACA
jgi:hypothetical protein